MRLLFAMYHPGFIRLFEPVIRQSLERGHELQLLFDRKARLGEESLMDELLASYERLKISYLRKTKNDRWVALATRFRNGADYLRYLDPRYGAAVSLHARAKKKAPTWVQWLGAGLLARSPLLLRAAMRLCGAIERALPVRASVLEALQRAKPDVVMVTPLILQGSDQVDFVKGCRELGLHCALGVASWDNLTNKGVVRVHPEVVFVWNHQQAEEAVTLHGFPADAVKVCGAWSYDHWFDWQADRSREDFLAQVGLEGQGDYLLYVCSSKFIAPHEAGFVRRWIEALRASGDERLASLGVLIRPHPQNAEQWEEVDFTGLGNVAVWPRGGANPINAQTRSTYFNSIYFSQAIVGINTSAQIESGIIGRPVFTIMTSEFAGTQEGTLHFHYLKDAEQGLLFSARDFDEHCGQLAEVLQAGDHSARSRRFVESFVRPQGLEQPAAPIIIDHLEAFAASAAPRPLAVGAATALVRLLLAPLRFGIARLPPKPKKA